MRIRNTTKGAGFAEWTSAYEIFFHMALKLTDRLSLSVYYGTLYSCYYQAYTVQIDFSGNTIVKF